MWVEKRNATRVYDLCVDGAVEDVEKGRKPNIKERQGDLTVEWCGDQERRPCGVIINNIPQLPKLGYCAIYGVIPELSRIYQVLLRKRIPILVVPWTVNIMSKWWANVQ